MTSAATTAGEAKKSRFVIAKALWFALKGALTILLLAMLAGTQASSAPFAAMVMDMRTGKVLYQRNANQRLYPASLTKMMTLYITFEAIKNGEITLDTPVTISRKAAAEPPSKLGLRPGRKIALRYLIRAAAIKSANDAATAIGEAIGGSEAGFARRMNRTAKALGMTRTTFRNANGLTRRGHLSTARDMTILGRHLFFDYPQYFNLFSRRTANAGGRIVHSSNHLFLSSYRGADGIKTGYTYAAGFNLVASAHRGTKRVIATVFGGRSSTSRNAEMAKLLNLGFRREPAHVAIIRPPLPRDGVARRTTRLAGAVMRSPRPMPRARRALSAPSLAAMLNAVGSNVAAARDSRGGDKRAGDMAAPATSATLSVTTPSVTAGTKPPARVLLPQEAFEAGEQLSEAGEGTLFPAPAPVMRVVSRVSTSGGHLWGITIGRYSNHYLAERALLTTALREMDTLADALRKISLRGGKYDANFVGMTQAQALLACEHMQAHDAACTVLGPTG